MKKFLILVILVAAIAYAVIYYIQSEAKGLKVIYIYGKAYLEPSKRVLQIGNYVPDKTSVKLLQASRCFLQALNGAVIKLFANTLVKVEKNSLHIQEGSLAYNAQNAIVAYKHPDITIPEGSVQVDSKDFNINVERNRSILCVYEGSLTLKIQDQEIVVHSSEGCIIKDGRVKSGLKLPEATTIKFPKNETSINAVPVSVECNSVKDAKLYQWECSFNREFTQVDSDDFLTGSAGKLTWPDEDGVWYIRVRAINGEGLAGKYSQEVGFTFGLHHKVRKYYSLVHNYYLNERYDLAIKEAKEGLALCGDYVGLLRYQALSFIKTNQVDEAIKMIKKLKDSPKWSAVEALEDITKQIQSFNPGHPVLKELEKR